MRERNAFEAELAALGLRDVRPARVAPRAFEVDEPREYETPPGRLEPYRIRGGLYTARQKAYHARHRAGLLLTVTVVGRQEAKLAGGAPETLTVAKEMARFEGGRLGQFVEDYNDFTQYFEEVLRSIGRLRDLLSVGAPEAPNDMTAVQKFALRPTDNSAVTNVKKKSYREWRNAQEQYAHADDRGGLNGGRVFETAETGREFDLARQAFWQAKGKLQRTIADAKRLDKPKYEEVDIKFSDIVSIFEGGWGLVVLADAALEARRNRADYDAKMKQFADIVKNTNAAVRDDFEAFNNAGKIYWARLATHRTSIVERNKARMDARQKAALFGQDLAPPSERRDPVLAAIRMPALVSDAWRTLALVGPPALKKLSSVLASGSLMDRAKFHYARPDPYGLSDLTNTLKAFLRAHSWKDVLTKDDVEEWIAMNRLWEETFNRFNV